MEGSLLKCKNCGNLNDVAKAVNGIIECECCFSKSTIPKKDISPAALSFIWQGEHDLDTCKFDDAYTAYAKAAEYDSKEPEAYWGMALAQFKVQYIKDIKNNRLQPICHEFTEKLFLQNENYLSAIKYATEKQKEVYIKRAHEIDYIRSEFLKLKQSGLDYDCFICVKVSEDGDDSVDKDRKIKTEDSKYAHEIYEMLEDKNYVPFYSEEVLKGVTGEDYEAHILYALYTSESMLVVCFDEKYLYKPWVKNEYSRFLKIIENENRSGSGLTIVYKGKPIEKLPGKAGLIQGIDASRPGYQADVLRFVEEHTPKAQKRKEEERQRKNKEAERAAQFEELLKLQRGNTVYNGLSVEDNYLKTAKAELDSGNYEDARAFYSAVLKNVSNECRAWWGLFLCEMRSNNYNSILANLNQKSADTIARSINLKNAEKFASGEIEAVISDFKTRYIDTLYIIKQKLKCEIDNKTNENIAAENNFVEKQNCYLQELENSKVEHKDLVKTTNNLAKKIRNRIDFNLILFDLKIIIKCCKVSCIATFVLLSILTLSGVAYTNSPVLFWGPQIVAGLLVPDGSYLIPGYDISFIIRLVSIIGCAVEALIYGIALIFLGWGLFTLARLAFILPYNCIMDNWEKKYDAVRVILNDTASEIKEYETDYNNLRKHWESESQNISNTINSLNSEIQIIDNCLKMIER